MANPLFEALNGNRMAGMLEQFQQFRKEMEQQMQGMFKGFFK